MQKNVIIILNYNDCDNTINYINSIKDYRIIDEIIVVDNASTDNSFSRLKKINNKKLTLLKNKENKGYSSGNNIGIKYAIEKYKKCNLIISNPDIEVSEEVIKNLTNHLKDENISAISPVIKEGKSLNRGWHLPNIWDEVKLSIPKKTIQKVLYYKDDYYKEELTKVDVVSGCFFIIKSTVFDKIGLLDENTFLYYEENILAKKLKDNNLNTYISNKDEIIHNHSVSIDKNKSNLEKVKILKKSQKYYVKNYCKKNILALFILNILNFINIFTKTKLFKQLFKFGIVGGTAFLIDYGIFALLIYLKVNYLIAQIISFTVSLIYNYILSIKWVFDAKKQTIKEILIFVGSSLIGLLINEILLYIGVDKLSYNELIVKLFATIIVMIYNFITRKLFIEKR